MTEISPGGSEIYRHTEAVGSDDVPEFDEGLRGALEAHLRQFLPGEPSVLHEIVPVGVHLDVYVWEPTHDRPLWTLVTMGMSERPMNAPAGAEDTRRAELVCTLPADWPMPRTPHREGNDPAQREEFEAVFSDEANYWPIEVTRMIAHLPSQFDSWVSFGHTIPAGEDPDETYPGSAFSGMMLSVPASLPKEAWTCTYDGEEIHLWGLYPLYPQEMDLRLQIGAVPLFDELAERGIHEGVLPGRELALPQDTPRKGLLGRIFGRK